MNISSIGSGGNPYNPQASQNSDAVSALQRQKEVLTKQLEAIKSRPKKSQAEQDAAVGQKKALEKQIAAIDQKIQNASQNKSGETSVSGNSQSMQAAENSASQKGSSIQTDVAKTISKQEIPKRNKSPYDNIGNMIDTYV